MTVVLDGRPVTAYRRAFDAGGHIYAPIRPYVTRVADRLWFDGNRLLIVRDGRRVAVELPSREPDALAQAYVPIAYVLRALGARVAFSNRTLVVQMRASVIARPTPYAGAAVMPRAVFTPTPPITPRPVWTGSPLPRRTPLPVTVPSPAPVRRERQGWRQLPKATYFW